MNHAVLKTNSQREEYINSLREIELPVSVWNKRVLPHATVDQYAYLWGCVLKEVGQYMGEPDIHKVYEDMLKMFNIEYSPLPHNPLVWQLRIKRGSELNVVEIGEFIEMIASWVATEFGGAISLPHPTEI